MSRSLASAARGVAARAPRPSPPLAGLAPRPCSQARGRRPCLLAQASHGPAALEQQAPAAALEQQQRQQLNQQQQQHEQQQLLEAIVSAQQERPGAAGAQLPLAARVSVLPLVSQPLGSDEDAWASLQWLSPGDFHARFTLGETLGQGTYGTVRACADAATGEQLAVKIISKRKGSEERLEAIAREVRTWRMLSHSPHIARLVGAFEDAANVYIVQELLAGGDLQSLLDAQGVLSEDEARAAARGVLSALAACHAAGVCYGDVKPSNFMLAGMYPRIAHILDPAAPKGDMALRLIDFGCSQYCPDGCSLLQGLSGTPVYMAPEVITESCYSLAMDTWATGVLLYQLLTGRFPFWDTDLAGLGRIHPRKLLQHIRDGAQPLLDVPACAHLSPEVKDLLAQLLNRDPAARISAAAALQHPWLAAQQQAGQ